VYVSPCSGSSSVLHGVLSSLFLALSYSLSHVHDLFLFLFFFTTHPRTTRTRTHTNTQTHPRTTRTRTHTNTQTHPHNRSPARALSLPPCGFVGLGSTGAVQQPGVRSSSASAGAPTRSRRRVQHRRAASAFRDNTIRKIFLCCLQDLRCRLDTLGEGICYRRTLTRLDCAVIV
jgi:hypothetical protein